MTYLLSVLPKRKIPADIRSLCRAYTDEAIRTLAGIMKSGAKDSDRVAATQILMDRGWGRAPQPLVGAEGKDIVITIRNDDDGKT